MKAEYFIRKIAKTTTWKYAPRAQCYTSKNIASRKSTKPGCVH